MPKVDIGVEAIHEEHLVTADTPTHVNVTVHRDGKKLMYQLTIQDEGIILETVSGPDGEEDLDTVVQTLYSEHPEAE